MLADNLVWEYLKLTTDGTTTEMNVDGSVVNKIYEFKPSDMNMGDDEDIVRRWK